MHEFTRELGARRRVQQTRGTRASPVLCVAGQCVPSGCVAAPGVVRGNVSTPGNGLPCSSREAASGACRTHGRNTKDEESREEKTAEDRGTELRYNILTRQNDRPAILQPQCVPFFLRHMRATVSPRISGLLLVETVKRADGERSIADERIENTGRRNEERERERRREGSNGVLLDGQILCDCQHIARHVDDR